MATLTTQVELRLAADRRTHYLVFGAPAHRKDLGAERALVYFQPGDVFGYLRWDPDEYGRPEERFWILQAGNPSDILYPVSGVSPGATVLLEARGGEAVTRVFKIVEDIEALGIAPPDVCPDHWRLVHNRLLTGLPLLTYSWRRHRAWLLRRPLRR